jgi:hypothetical protein
MSKKQRSKVMNNRYKKTVETLSKLKKYQIVNREKYTGKNRKS